MKPPLSAPSFFHGGELAKLKRMQQVLAEAKLKRLSTMDVCVLDNSLRETAVAQIKGAVTEDKDKILDALRFTGIEEVIVGAFGDLRRPEDEWLQAKAENGKIEGNWWCFSEMYDAPEPPFDSMPLPYALQRIKSYGVRNVILELDVGCLGLERVASTGNFEYTKNGYHDLIKDRVDFIRSQIHPKAKIFINLRDSPTAYFDKKDSRNLPKRLTMIIRAIAALRPRINGLLFEDPVVEVPHWALGELSAHMRLTMDSEGWKDGHLLIHIHKKYGLSDAAVLEALAMGCTGIWCAVCEEGGGIGHASSITTLVNLARLGNEKVLKKYNLGEIHMAAIKVTKIATGQLPFPRTEVFGARALDQLFPAGGGMGERDDQKGLADYIGSKEVPRISPFADPQMMTDKLDHYFGTHVWDEIVIKMMTVVLNSDLAQGRKWEYNGPAGLLDLYDRSGGTEYLDDMEAKLIEFYLLAESADPLIKELKNVFDRAKSVSLPLERNSAPNRETPKGKIALTKRFSVATLVCFGSINDADALSYLEFAEAFLGNYHNHAPDALSEPIVMKIINFIDADQDGKIQWRELCSRALWALENTDDDDTSRWTLRDLLDHLFSKLCFAEAQPTQLRKKMSSIIDDIFNRAARDERLQSLFEGADLDRLKSRGVLSAMLADSPGTDHQSHGVMRLMLSDTPDDQIEAMVRKHRLLFRKGLNQTHFEAFTGHIIAALKHAGVEESQLEFVMSNIEKFRRVFTKAVHTEDDG